MPGLRFILIMCLCFRMCTCAGALWMSKEDLEFPGARVTGNCEPDVGTVEKQQLLTVEPSLPPLPGYCTGSGD